MFYKNLHRNSFLTKSCSRLEENISNNLIRNKLAEKYTDLSKLEKQMVIIQCEQQKKDELTIGYGKNGFKDLVKILVKLFYYFIFNS